LQNADVRARIHKANELLDQVLGHEFQSMGFGDRRREPGLEAKSEGLSAPNTGLNQAKDILLDTVGDYQ